MRFTPLTLLSFAPAVVLAQNLTFLEGLVATLQSAGNLSQTINVATSLNNTPAGIALLTNISNGEPHLIFAPTDQAWSTAPSNVTGNSSVLTDVFSYHIVQGNFTGAVSHYPNTTVGQTLYNDPATVHLEGGKAQALAWAVRSDGQTHVLNQRNDTLVVNVLTYENLTIAEVDHVLNVPERLADTVLVDDDSLSGFEVYLRATQLAVFNVSTNQTEDITFFDAFDVAYRGFTLFAPNTSAVDTANSTLENSLATNRTAINAIMFNHLINATTLYSPLLAGSENFTSQAGQTFSFTLNETGHFVTQGNTTARIIQPDVLLPNGVVHIIDAVLLNTDADAGAADSALSSAVSAATQSTATAAQTGPIGFSATQSLAGPATSSGSVTAAQNTASTNAAAARVTAPLSTGPLVGVVAALISVVAGGLFTLV